MRFAAHAGVYGVRLGIEAETAIDGGRHENDAEFIPVPQLYLGGPVSDRLAAGVGLNAPFGLRTDWGPATPFSVVATETDLTYATAWGVLAYELNDQLSIGGGIGVTYADGTLKRFLAPPSPVAEFEFEGDDISTNWIASLLWKPDERHSFGLTYRARTELDLEGTAGAPAIGLAIPAPPLTWSPLTPWWQATLTDRMNIGPWKLMWNGLTGTALGPPPCGRLLSLIIQSLLTGNQTSCMGRG